MDEQHERDPDFGWLMLLLGADAPALRFAKCEIVDVATSLETASQFETRLEAALRFGNLAGRHQSPPPRLVHPDASPAGWTEGRKPLPGIGPSVDL
jgi:hypothetical protein